MRRRSVQSLWLLCGVLLIASAGLAAWSTWVNWLPCQGSIGSEACLFRMDQGGPAFPFPATPSQPQRSAAIIGWAAQLLAATAWLALILIFVRSAPERRARRWTALLLLIPSLLVMLWDGWIIVVPTVDADAWSLRLLLLVELAAVISLAVVLVAVNRGWEEPDGVVRAALTLWGVSAFGLVHGFGDYFVLILVSSADWDVPPGTGYPTAVVLLVAGLAAMTGAAPGWHPWRRSGDDADDSELSGRSDERTRTSEKAEALSIS